MIEIQSLEKIYSKKVVLNNLNLRLPDTGIIGILGPNGSGKTTFYKLLTGLISANSGKVMINDKTIIKSKRKKKIINKPFNHISYFPDDKVFYPIRVSELLEITLIMYVDFNIEKAKEILNIFDVNIAENIENLSKGQKMVINFALTASRETKIYFLDEPFDGIDIEFQELILTSINKFINTDEKLLIISSHEISDIGRILDEYLILNNGLLIEHQKMEHLNEMGIELIDYFIDRIGGLNS